MWVKSSSNIKPLEVDEALSKKYVYMRRNITEIKEDDDVRYEYEECTVPKEMFPIVQDLQSRIDEQNKLISSLAEKQGYNLVQSGNVIEYVKDDTVSQPMGDFLNPIIYAKGMECIVGMFYTNGEDIWECIKAGTPADFNDKRYFDIK